jgi:hypothetical protein
MKSFQPIVLAAAFAHRVSASTATATATAANANEPQVFSPYAAIIESELAIAQSQLGTGTRTSDGSKYPLSPLARSIDHIQIIVERRNRMLLMSWSASGGG